MTRHLHQRAIDTSLHSSAISILLIFGKKKPQQKTTPKFRRRGSAHRSPPSKPGIARPGSRAVWRKSGRSRSRCGTKHRQLPQMLLVSPQTAARAPGARDGGLSAQPRRTAAAWPSRDTTRTFRQGPSRDGLTAPPIRSYCSLDQGSPLLQGVPPVTSLHLCKIALLSQKKKKKIKKLPRAFCRTTI